MAHEFDPGIPSSLTALVADYPGAETYPAKDFRVEWGPIFHRGRLDGSARVVVIGQDPATHESVVRRILVGEAGQRIQGFLAKLGIDRSYVMVNTFLYSVYGQGGGNRHKDDANIALYRNRWLDALAARPEVQAVVALGGLADNAYQLWCQTPSGAAAAAGHVYQHVLHPTYPESSSASGQTTKAKAVEALLENWNGALGVLSPAITPDTPTALVPYGTAFADGDLVTIPERDLPAGLPEWMRSLDAWASRLPVNEAAGAAPKSPEVVEAKRAGLGIRIPTKQRVWH